MKSPPVDHQLSTDADPSASTLSTVTNPVGAFRTVLDSAHHLRRLLD
jgi:hypothetical protein